MKIASKMNGCNIIGSQTYIGEKGRAPTLINCTNSLLTSQQRLSGAETVFIQVQFLMFKESIFMKCNEFSFHHQIGDF